MISKGVVSLREVADNRRREKIPTGVVALDRLAGGLIRGGMCELVGEDGAGKRSIATSLAASATHRGGLCGIVDGTDGFDPVSAQRCGVTLERVLWVRCGGDISKAVLSAEHLVQSGLFEFIWLDLAGFSEHTLASLPSSYWYRFKSGLSGSATSMIVTLTSPRVRSAAHQSFRLSMNGLRWSDAFNFRMPEVLELHLECMRPVPASTDMAVAGI